MYKSAIHFTVTLIIATKRVVVVAGFVEKGGWMM